MEITRRLFLQFLSALPFYRPREPRPEPLCGLAFPLVFPDGLDGRGEHGFYQRKHYKFYLPVIK